MARKDRHSSNGRTVSPCRGDLDPLVRSSADNAKINYGATHGCSKTYLTAAVAGAMTAGIGVASVAAVPPDVAEPAQPRVADVDLAASITIPIIDIDTPGPISISRLLTLTLKALPNNLSAILDSEAGTIYDLPGLYTNFSSSGEQNFFANRVPGQSIGFGFTSAGPEDNAWRVLGDFATGETHIRPSRELGLDVLYRRQ